MISYSKKLEPDLTQHNDGPDLGQTVKINGTSCEKA